MTCQECELLLASGDSAPDHVLTCAACRALSEDLRLNALALQAMRNEGNVGQDGILRPVPNRPVRASAALLATAALVIAAIALSQLGQRALVEPPRVTIAVTPPQFTAPPPTAKPVSVKARPAPVEKSPPLVVKMLTDDPDVVVYWLIDAKEGP